MAATGHPKSPQTPRPVLLRADRKVGFFFAGSVGQGQVAAEQRGQILRWSIGILT